MTIRNLLMVALITMLSLQATAEESPKQGEAKTVIKVKDDFDPKAWGIERGCIRTTQIRSFRYFEPGAARVELTGRKSVLIRFTNKCSGLRNNGVIYETRTGELCEGFDSVRVLRQGNICPIESIEPYIEPEKADQEEQPSE